MIAGYRIEGHAIVSADDRIADRDGNTPAELRNEADWLRFQAALDAAAVTVLGRLSHDANPNDRGRNRLVVSSSSAGIERRDGAWWWNPGRAALVHALAEAVPGGGTVAVPGGRLIFDLFRTVGFDTFHLARCERVTIPGGIPLFSAVERGVTAEALLESDGLVPGTREILDSAAGVSVVTWRRPGA